MKLSKQIRHIAEYGAARLGLAMADMLPLSAAEALVFSAADCWYAVGASRRKIALDNVVASGICTDLKEAARIVRRSYRHFGRVIIESLKSSAILDTPGGDERVTVRIAPEMEKLLDDPRQGIILATGHYGSWEIAAQILSRRKPVTGVTRRMNNPHVDRLMQRLKPRDRFNVVPKYDPANVGRFPQILGNGGILALMIDQHAGGRGMAVDFFGRPASTHTAVALLHLVTRSPLCFGYCRRTGHSGYELCGAGPFRFEPSGDKQRDIRLILETLNRELEKAIREDPAQYLWAHRRWR